MKTSLAVGSIVSIIGFISAVDAAEQKMAGRIDEFPINWDSGATGSTHELACNPDGGDVFWVTGMNHDRIARVTLDGKADIFKMPEGSKPHGVVFDAGGRLWISLEYHGKLVQINQTDGAVIQTIDVQLHAKNAAKPINTHPHGLGLDADGRTIWFTGEQQPE